MLLIDHVIALVLVLLVPVCGRWSWHRLEHALSAGQESARLPAYSRTILIQWSLAVVVLVTWIVLGRSLDSTGLAAPLGAPFIAALVLVMIAAAFLLIQVSAVRRLDDAGGASLQGQLASVEKLLPHTAGERDVFIALSATAGFCEELLYRGFLIGYLAAFTGVAGAVAASAVIFGVIHAYQGRIGVLKTGTIGLLMGLIYVFSGSIWPAIVLHVAFDVQGGLIGYEVFSPRPAMLQQ